MCERTSFAKADGLETKETPARPEVPTLTDSSRRVGPDWVLLCNLREEERGMLSINKINAERRKVKAINAQSVTSR